MKSQTAFSKHTKSSELPSTKVVEPSNTSTAPTNVIYREFQLAPQAKAPVGAIDIDDLVAEFEQSAESADAIGKGRKWVANTFYADKVYSIAKLRLQKGWSQVELAKRADTSQPYIARLELGKVDPQLSTIKKIAKALGVSAVTVLEAISPDEDVP